MPTIFVKQKGEYPIGWLYPDGTFEECLTGEHFAVARMIIEKKHKEDYRENIRLVGHNCPDYLVLRNYVLLDCPPQNGTLFITYEKMTNKQKDFLMDKIPMEDFEKL